MNSGSPIYLKLRPIILILGIIVVLSMGCRAVTGLPSPSKSVTQTVIPTQVITLVWTDPAVELTQTAPPVQTVTAAPSQTKAPAATLTPLPAGTVVNIHGVIQQIRTVNNNYIIIVNNVEYHVPQQILIVILKHLRVGAPIDFTGQADARGVIIIINVVKINNVTIIINQHPQGQDDHGDEDEGD